MGGRFGERDRVSGRMKQGMFRMGPSFAVGEMRQPYHRKMMQK